MYRKLATAAMTAAAALFTRAPLAHAQKALVYCPVGVDATGCDRIVAALSPKFTEGVDRVYDGSAGTLDLEKVDLQHYSVFVVPSLADDGDKQPYALLRKLASRLHYAINGRVAVYSGAPDQGNSNRADKDALIQNLAKWAGDGHTRRSGLVGMVAFLDLSENESVRYSWVREVSLVDVSADTEDQSIGEATQVGTRGGDLLKVNGRQLAFTNMASNGLHIGNRGAARTEVGAMGGANSRQSILITYANADGPSDGMTTGKTGSSSASFSRSAGGVSLDVSGASSSLTSGATLTTNKPDYQPGDTVTFTGAGFVAGDTVTITVHEDPTWSYPDRQFKSVADGSGAFTNRQMIIDQQDLGATFTATAVGNPSGTVAQTIFTDGSVSLSLATAGTAIPAGQLGSFTWQVNYRAWQGQGQNANTTCSGNPTSSGTALYTGSTAGNGNGSAPSANDKGSLMLDGVSATGAFAGQYVFDYWSTTATSTTAVVPTCLPGQPNNDIIATYFAHFKSATQTTNITISSSSLSSTYGTSVTFTATASVANAAGSIQFKIDGVNFGLPVALSAAATSSATISTATLSAATHPVTAVYTPGPGFTAGTVNTINQIVSQKTVTVATLTVSNKVYDATTTATLTGGTLSGVVAGDELTVGLNIPGAAATFANKNVGIGKAVAVTGLALTGTAAGNYTPSSTSGATTANITPLGVTGSITTNNKVYDGTTTATAQTASVVTAIINDVVSLTPGTLAFDTKAVGTAKPVTASAYTLTGADAGNYLLGTVTASNANITALALTAAITADNKIYDGTTTATIHGSPLAGAIGGDALTLTVGVGTFADKAVGTNKTVTAPVSLSNTDAGNYTLTAATASATANITARALVVSATGVDKPYDGTTSATVTLLDNRVTGDALTDAYATATFADKNVGTGKTVSVSGVSVSGTDAGNYTFNTTTSTTASITPRALTITATGVNKVYDGNTTATVTLGDNRIAGDVFTGAFGSAGFATKNAGTGKTINVTGITITGTDAGNYTANTTATATADITPRALTVTATGVNKVYDGTPAATVTLADNRVSGDVFTDSYTSAAFADKHVGASKPVSVTGISISGTDGGNYTPNTIASATASITARALIVTAVATNKVYDANTTAAVTLSDNRVAGDALTTSFTSATFGDKNVGAAKTVTVSGIALGGADNGDYTFNTIASTTADITALAITGHITASNKVYDATTAATIATRTLTGALGGDGVSYTGGAATFADKNVGPGKTVTGTGLGLSGADAGNYTVNSTAATTADITQLGVTGSIVTANKVYDANTTASPTTASVVTKLGSDAVILSGGTLAFADKNVGTGKAVTAAGWALGGADAPNYLLGTVTASAADITALAISGHVTADNKVYNGTTAATIASRTLTGVLGADAVSYTGGTATFDTKNVGTHKTVTATGLSLGSTDAGNYTVNTTAAAYADITPRALAITVTGVDRIYDGTTVATVTLSDNRVSGDVLTGSYATASFADKNVGTGKTVSVSGISISGTDAGNYTFNATAATTASITARTLVVTAHGTNKVYDGLTTATVTLTDDRVSGDVFTDAFTGASFVDKHAGTGKTVSVSGISISGTDAGNYAANTSAATTADITPRALAIAAHGMNKIYDGTTAATVTLTDNRVSGDTFTDNYTSAAFADKNVGAGKAVTANGISISGADAGDYTFNTTASTTADITQRALTITATGVNKVYDGNNTATVNLADNRVGGDVFTDAFTTATFADKNVGNGKTVTVSGISISGTDASNYSFNITTTTTANITPRQLTGAITADSKVYDGTTTAAVHPVTLTGTIAGDGIGLSATAGTFSDKNVGTGKTVTATISLTGGDAGNYSLSSTTATTTADITRRPLLVSAHGVSKVYDATTAATVTLTDDRVSGDILTDTPGSASFTDKNVGIGKTVSVSGISISGADAGNYTANATASTTADITPFAIAGHITASNKIYDANDNAAILTRTLTGVFTGDVVDYVGGTAHFSNKNVGTHKAVTATGLSLGSTDAGNYTVNATATTYADITPKALTVSAHGVNRVYDGTTAATASLTDDHLGTDVVTGSYTSATFADKNVGVGKAVSVSGISISGADAGNYTFNPTASTTADITTRALAVSAQGVNKVYDANATTTVTLSDDRVSGDVFTDAYTSASFNNKNVGTGKPVSVSGISISGTDAGNYTFNATTSTTANITPKALTISATGANKIYDGTTAATVTLSDNRISGDVFTDSYASASFADKNVGAGKAVSVSGISTSGTDAGNYTFNTTASTTADITQRALAITATGVTKVYDGNNTATVNLADNRVGGDVFTDAYATATFANKDVGNGIGVSVSGISISGADAGNYTFNTTAATTANITKRLVTVTVADKQVVWTGSSITPPYTISLTAPSTMAAGETFYSTLGTPAFTPPTVVNVGVYAVNVSGLNNTNYMVSTVAGTLTVLDETKPAGTITSLNPVPLNTGATLQVNFNDVSTGNSNITAWKYSIDGTPAAPISVSGTPNFNTSATLPPFNTTDVKQVCVTGQDAGGNWSPEVCALLAIYDPTAGFVTGGGWFLSPERAYVADPTLTGKANFGFNSKYQKGANTPTGNTEFQFQAGNLNFSSTNFQWLVIQGTTQSQFKGTGTINGTGKYNFLVTAIDGDNFNGTKKPDGFRIKITDFVTGAVVYDNQIGKDDSGADATVLGGGSIVIHDK